MAFVLVLHALKQVYKKETISVELYQVESLQRLYLFQLFLFHSFQCQIKMKLLLFILPCALAGKYFNSYYKK